MPSSTRDMPDRARLRHDLLRPAICVLVTLADILAIVSQSAPAAPVTAMARTMTTSGRTSRTWRRRRSTPAGGAHHRPRDRRLLAADGRHRALCRALFSAASASTSTSSARQPASFPLGTDYLGRDMLSRVLYGARYTIGLALAATVLACLAGTTLGLLAAAVGGWLDAASAGSRCPDLDPEPAVRPRRRHRLQSSLPVLVAGGGHHLHARRLPHRPLARRQRQRDRLRHRRAGARRRHAATSCCRRSCPTSSARCSPTSACASSSSSCCSAA